MEQLHLLKQLQQEISNMPGDIKAEVLLGLALDSGLSTADFMIACNGFFSREYSKDMLSSEIVEDADKLHYLQVTLSRSGIYDQLPEGLFYQPDKKINQPLDAANMADEYKRDKKKEQDIRRFFIPFEKAIFQQRLQLEKEETRLLHGFQSRILNAYFIDFWGLAPHIQQSFAIPLIGLLPYAYRIAGHADLTGRCLQSILKEPVTVKRRTAWDTLVPANQVCEVGKQRLGINMVSGKQFREDHTVMEFTIGPLMNSAVADYLPGGNCVDFLETFYSFFVPAEAEVKTVINVKPHEKNMRLQTTAAPILGYTSVL